MYLEPNSLKAAINDKVDMSSDRRLDGIRSISEENIGCYSTVLPVYC